LTLKDNNINIENHGLIGREPGVRNFPDFNQPPHPRLILQASEITMCDSGKFDRRRRSDGKERASRIVFREGGEMSSIFGACAKVSTE
jgi:hypothetical protein